MERATVWLYECRNLPRHNASLQISLLLNWFVHYDQIFHIRFDAVRSFDLIVNKLGFNFHVSTVISNEELLFSRHEFMSRVYYMQRCFGEPPGLSRRHIPYSPLGGLRVQGSVSTTTYPILEYILVVLVAFTDGNRIYQAVLMCQVSRVVYRITETNS